MRSFKRILRQCRRVLFEDGLISSAAPSKANAYSENQSNLRNSVRQTKDSFLNVRKTALLHRTDELALIQPERISTEWTNELRRNIRVYPTCNLWRALLSLDVYTRTVLYAFLIKGWSSSRIAEHLDVSLIIIQELLENGREQLQRELATLSSGVASQ
jgi:DNA-directed RNA polymerase specialized sigma24 family protein